MILELKVVDLKEAARPLADPPSVVFIISTERGQFRFTYTGMGSQEVENYKHTHWLIKILTDEDATISGDEEIVDAILDARHSYFAPGWKVNHSPQDLMVFDLQNIWDVPFIFWQELEKGLAALW